MATKSIFEAPGPKQTNKDFEPAPDEIKTSFGSRLGDLGVIPGTVRVGRVYVRVGDDFV